MGLFPAPPIFHTCDIHAPTIIAAATKFGKVTYHDQAKKF